MSVERWYNSYAAIIAAHDAINFARKNGPVFLPQKDARKLAIAFSKLMLNYGLPGFAPLHREKRKAA